MEVIMEYWDLYDKDKKMLDRKAIRGEKLNEGEFHLVVNAWVKSDDGEFLIGQRAEGRSYPLQWECTGGSAVMGETSLEAGIRELKEELGFQVFEHEGKYIGSKLRYYPNCDDILEVWLFYTKNKNQKLVFQKEEVNDARWATREEILKLREEGKFEANAFFDEVLNS